MTKQSSFWSACESIPGLAAVEAEWKRKAGDEYAAARVFLKPRQEPATSCPCPSEHPCGCYHRVVDHGEGRLVAVCCCDPQVCDTVPVTESDLIVYELDRRRLHAAIGKVLSLKLSEAVVPNLRKTTQIGFDSPLAGYNFPVYLTVQHDPDDFHKVVFGLAARNAGPFIVIAPTGDFHSPDSMAALAGRKALFLSLSEIISLPAKGKPTANPNCADILARFHESLLPKRKGPAPVEFFPTPPNSTWGDMHLHFLNEHEVNVRVKAVSGNYDFRRMGMVNRTSDGPSEQWKLLILFRNAHGVLTWENPKADPKNKKRKQLLSESLQRFFRIDGDPFGYDKGIKGWYAFFHFD